MNPRNAKRVSVQIIARVAVSALFAAAVVLPATFTHESPGHEAVRQVEPVMYVDCDWWGTVYENWFC